MKIEVFILPKDGEVQRTPPNQSVDPASAAGTSSRKGQRVSVVQIPWKLTALSFLLVCIFIVCGMAAYSAYNAISAMDELSVRRSPMVTAQIKADSSANPAGNKSRVHLFDNSRQLHRGDVVVVRQKSGANVGEVAVSANSAGVVKRGGNVEALYLLGQDRYVVTSEGGSQIVRGQDIFATVASTAKQR